MKKLIPGELYEPPKLLPLIKDDKSFTNAIPSTSTANVDKQAERQVVRQSEKEGKKQGKKQVERQPMVISIDKKKLQLIKVKEEKSNKEKMDEIFAIPKVKKSTKVVGCHMPGLPHCILSQAFCDKVKEIEDKKQENRDSIKKCKAEWKAQRRTEKAREEEGR